MRVQHLMAPAKSDTYPANVICLQADYRWARNDASALSETALLTHWVGVWFAGASGDYGPNHTAEGDTAEEFWDALRERLRRGGTYWIFSESAALVCALLELWGMVERRAVDLCGHDERSKDRDGHNGKRKTNMRAVLEEPPFILEGKMRGAGGKFKILDVANYGRQPSAGTTPASDISISVAAFVRGMVAALKSRGMGSLKDTVGTQAMFSFRRAHLKHLVQCHADRRALALESDAYYGGRCEAFKLGRIGGRVYHLDVSAMYPYCAAAYETPLSLVGHAADLGSGDQDQLGEGYGLIADVTIDTDEAAYPYRKQGMAVTVWPVGNFRTVLAEPELHDALSKGRIIRWHRASWYRLAPLLQSYARCVLDMRGAYKDRPDLLQWVKGLGVCLIGKLGQRERRWVDARSNVFHHEWGTWWEKREGEQWTRFRSISNYTQREEVGDWCYDALPAVAAWVCSLARLRLLQMIRCARWEDTYYCDTDALMVSHAGMTRLQKNGWIRENEPGYLRVKNVSEVVDIHGIKSYDEEGRSVRAGQPLSLARHQAGGCWYWQRRTAAVCTREGRPPDASRVAIRFDRQAKYQHGEVTATGDVVPFQLSEG